MRVADPLENKSRFSEPHLLVAVERVISAILLGVLTYDANLLVAGAARGRRVSQNGAMSAVVVVENPERWPLRLQGPRWSRRATT